MNKLANETSPYLLQHADNPVDWWPWGPEALSYAESAQRPLFVSVGYSSCHWCHVMAHESFEDPETARYLNEHFVSVKVDREERPDIDDLYMRATVAMNGHGGWPMSVFTLPDGRPFFTGTYFPPVAKGGMPSFRTVLEAIVEAWQTRRSELEEHAADLTQAISNFGNEPVTRSQGQIESFPLPPDEASRFFQLVADELAKLSDFRQGGFGNAPKFPHPDLIELGLRSEPSSKAREAAYAALDAMAAGGIYDHLAGGFARYSTDKAWLVPHFEKMLYDQAGLIEVYTRGFQATASPRWSEVVHETVGYLIDYMSDDNGGFYAAEDADSEGVEGKFYIWSREEISRHCDDEELLDVFCEAYGITEGGNFEGGNILHRTYDEFGLASRLSGNESQLPDEFRGAYSTMEFEDLRSRLLETRNKRVRPGLDYKIICEWNSMTTAALADAARTFGMNDWKDRAQKAGEFTWSMLRRSDGRLMRTFQKGSAKHLAFAADYAWAVEAFIRLYSMSGKAEWVGRARQVADGLIELFGDETQGGFFTNGADDDGVFARQKDFSDGPIPSANSIAARTLWTLGRLTGESLYTNWAEGTVRACMDKFAESPLNMPSMAAVFSDMARPGPEIVVATDDRTMLDQAFMRYIPGSVIAWGEPFESPIWDGKKTGSAYVCVGFICESPASDAATLGRQLKALSG